MLLGVLPRTGISRNQTPGPHRGSLGMGNIKEQCGEGKTGIRENRGNEIRMASAKHKSPLLPVLQALSGAPCKQQEQVCPSEHLPP